MQGSYYLVDLTCYPSKLIKESLTFEGIYHIHIMVRVAFSHEARALPV